MLNLRNFRVLCKGKKNLLKFSRNAFSSNGKDPKVAVETIAVPSTEEKQWNDLANWELLGMRGYRFCLPGNIGLSPIPPRKLRTPGQYKKIPRPKKVQSQYAKLPETNYMRHTEIVTQLAVLAHELAFIPTTPHTFHCQAVDCPYLLRDLVLDLFPRANVSHGSLTAVCVSLRFLPKSLEKDLQKLINMFEETARRVCGKLSSAGFWADFPTSEPVAPDTATAAQMEAAQQLSSPGMTVLHVSGCVLLMHVPLQDSRILGWLFTSASLDDPKLVEILQAENI